MGRVYYTVGPVQLSAHSSLHSELSKPSDKCLDSPLYVLRLSPAIVSLKELALPDGQTSLVTSLFAYTQNSYPAVPHYYVGVQYRTAMICVYELNIVQGLCSSDITLLAMPLERIDLVTNSFFRCVLSESHGNDEELLLLLYMDGNDIKLRTLSSGCSQTLFHAPSQCFSTLLHTITFSADQSRTTDRRIAFFFTDASNLQLIDMDALSPIELTVDNERSESSVLSLFALDAHNVQSSGEFSSNSPLFFPVANDVESWADCTATDGVDTNVLTGGAVLRVLCKDDAYRSTLLLAIATNTDIMFLATVEFRIGDSTDETNGHQCKERVTARLVCLHSVHLPFTGCSALHAMQRKDNGTFVCTLFPESWDYCVREVTLTVDLNAYQKFANLPFMEQRVLRPKYTKTISVDISDVHSSEDRIKGMCLISSSTEEYFCLLTDSGFALLLDVGAQYNYDHECSSGKPTKQPSEPDPYSAEILEQRRHNRRQRQRTNAASI